MCSPVVLRACLRWQSASAAHTGSHRPFYARKQMLWSIECAHAAPADFEQEAADGRYAIAVHKNTASQIRIRLLLTLVQLPTCSAQVHFHARYPLGCLHSQMPSAACQLDQNSRPLLSPHVPACVSHAQHVLGTCQEIHRYFLSNQISMCFDAPFGGQSWGLSSTIADGV